jgi:hypothetical protein
MLYTMVYNKKQVYTMVYTIQTGTYHGIYYLSGTWTYCCLMVYTIVYTRFLVYTMVYTVVSSIPWYIQV